jgi:hypothetical protein
VSLYDPEGVHVGDDADPHGHGFTLLAYVMIGDDRQGAICLIPKTHRLAYEGSRNEGDRVAGFWGGNYLTYLWDGEHFLDPVAHWNLVDAVERYVDELGGER